MSRPNRLCRSEACANTPVDAEAFRRWYPSQRCRCSRASCCRTQRRRQRSPSARTQQLHKPSSPPRRRLPRAPVDHPSRLYVQTALRTAPARAATPATPPSPRQLRSGSHDGADRRRKDPSDAEALAEALRKNGFTPTIRTETVRTNSFTSRSGPFGNRDDAKAMRQKLSSAATTPSSSSTCHHPPDRFNSGR